MNEFIQLNRFGAPGECCSLERQDDLPAPGSGEVQIELLACPINPAEILLIKGLYASRPPLPARLGIEGVGRVVAVGDAVDGLERGDLAMSLSRQNWSRRLNLNAAEVLKLPADLDPEQASMLKVNPATALMMLTQYRDLSPGDWVIQNAANSGVGHYLIQIARARGLRSVNVVRRDGLEETLRAAGADRVVVDGDDLAERVRDAVDGADIGLAIDAVAGAATRRLADCLADDGVVVNYGLLSGEACQITADQLIFRQISLRGFWLAKRLGSMPRDEIETLYRELGAMLQDGKLSAPVEARYPLERFADALDHAERERRGGKILLTPSA